MEAHAFGMSKGLISAKERIKCNNIKNDTNMINLTMLQKKT